MSAGWKLGMQHTDEARHLMGAARLGLDPSEYRQQIEAGTRWCSACRRWEAVDRFGPHSGRRSGLDSRCLEAGREKARQRMARLRTGQKAS